MKFSIKYLWKYFKS